MSGRATCGSVILAVALTLSAVPARAQDTNRIAAATLLFDEGVRALDAGRLDEACAKLAKSQELAPSGGTLLALGECHERAGRIASAWVAFRGAAARAAGAGKADAEASALEHASKLEPKLARITLRNTGATANIELLRDGTAVTTSELGVAVPVDPGKHEIQASAPGARPWTRTVQLAPGTEATVDVPTLESETRDAATEEDPGKTQRTIGLVAGGVGAGSLIAGAIFGILASSANRDGEKQCSGRDCSQAGLDAIDDASSKATVSTIFFAFGAALLAGGAVLYFSAPKPRHGAFLDWSSATLRW